MNANITQKEISPGIILLKHIQPGPEMIYIFKVQLNRLNCMEFIADFTGSENILVDGQNKMKTITIINPFETKQVAQLTMKQDWKLKTKFKFSLKTADKTIQSQYLKEDQMQLTLEIQDQMKQLYHYPFQLKEVPEILRYLKSPFVDPEFLPVDSSIFGDEETELDTLIQWRRPSAFFQLKDANKRPEIFFDKIEPNDIKQGALGNCWFLSALSSLAERPALVKRLFVTMTTNSLGIYRIKICKNGEWVYVTIDDLFPCYPLGAPIFSAAHGNELWVLLLEKAYAKLHGSYFGLREGLSGEAMVDLTGCPTVVYGYSELQQMWQQLLQFDQEGYLINAFTEGNDTQSEGQRKEQQGDNIGLIPGHAYSILQVKEAKGNKLLNIRNPWGNFEWKGAWSDTSPLWTQEIQNLVNFVNDSNDGQFWMCWKDFLNYFKGVNICKVRNWEEVRIKGKFIKVTDINDNNIDVVLSKWYYSFVITKSTKVIFGIHQEDERIRGVKLLRPYLDIGLTLFKQTEKGLELIAQTITKQDRQVQLEYDLNPGVYVVVPRTSGLYLYGENTNQINLLNNDGSVHPLLYSTLNDIFRKFDMLLLRELSYIEFKGIYDCLEKQLDPEYFKQMLTKYTSTEKGITFTGFVEFFIDQIKQLGIETIYRWLEKLGYDKNLNSIKSRCFIFTAHSSIEISVTVRDAINTDLNNRVHVFATTFPDQYHQIENIKTEREGIRVIQCYNRYSDTFCIIAINDQTYPIECFIDLTLSKGLILSTKTSKVLKRLDSGQMETMIHFRSNRIQKLKLSIQVKWQPVQ
ncbi:unnamed protein product [Paramecium pentaurelia]|uniref:Calpain catalytic domain-containing protein n=1 Tax=Paramecium pentaurelia TaxID=43138 RepID=A0A8S1VT73_9CILI|nr:unnamed protein product [Paramecium pentaurelia]